MAEVNVESADDGELRMQRRETVFDNAELNAVLEQTTNIVQGKSRTFGNACAHCIRSGT